jgi:acetolactate synthase-1/2/3 large subunit
VLGLFENVVTGAADGYARMTDRPAATLLHCGPGLANGLAGLHNARRAASPIVNLVGDQATHHQPLDPPLTTDTEGLARPMSAWVRTARDAASVGADAAVAVQAARTAPGQIATLILPSDTCWNEGGRVTGALPVPERGEVPPAAIEQVAAVLRGGEPVTLVLGGIALRARPLGLAQRIAAATGAGLIASLSNARVERGRGRVPIERVPYGSDAASDALRGIRHLVVVGTRKPVNFFAYPGKPASGVPDDCIVHVLARPEQDAVEALARLADLLDAPPCDPPKAAKPVVRKGRPTSEAVAETLAAVMPEGAIVVDESVSFGRDFFRQTHGAPPHDWLQNMGGAIGHGPPLATGAAVGAPGRRVINLQADGSAMYTLQALWTQAREKLDVTTVILANRRYQILLGELASVGANPGRTAMDMLNIGDPTLDWTSLAAGMGVEAARTATLEGFADLLASSCRRKGPFLIELEID